MADARWNAKAIAPSLGHEHIDAARDPWRRFADDHTLHLQVDGSRRLSMAGRSGGIEIAIASDEDASAGLLTCVMATPRIALHGHVHVRQATWWEWAVGPLRRPVFLHRAIHRCFVVRRSSDAMARAVLDERASVTLGGLLPLFHELSYEAKRIRLAWRGVERRLDVLEDAVACITYLAVAAAASPYR